MHIFENLKMREIFIKWVTKFKNNQILLVKIGHRFQAQTKLFTGLNIPTEFAQVLYFCLARHSQPVQNFFLSIGWLPKKASTMKNDEKNLEGFACNNVVYLYAEK
jgi:hypothetical protein